MPHVDEMLGFVTVASAGLLAAIAIEPITDFESIRPQATDAPPAIIRPATELPALVCLPAPASPGTPRGPA